MAWWRENNLRLVQINMRDIDGGMDVDKLIAELKEFCCSVVMVGAGGISAFYPTRLEFQRTSPWLEDRDLLGEIIEKCHREGIRVIARFDFSKTHQSFFRRHPEWYYRSEDGRAVPYNDTVATCVCGEYQQERALEIIGEVLQGYPVDGIFFNMFGFITWDYSGNYYGPCHCDCCKKRFAEFSGGKELPKTEDPGEPDFREYRAFQEQVVEELLGRVHRLVRSYGDDIAVCTYHHSDVDIIRDESNSAVDRPLPFWLYNSSSNVAKVRSSWDNKIISNCVINAADLFYRFSAVPPALTRLRLYENMAEGSGLDFCIIGVFEGYPDQDSVSAAKEVFRYHAEHQEVYGRLDSLAKLAVLLPLSRRESPAYRGVFRALKELHLPFDCILDARAAAEPSLLERYTTVLVPELGEVLPEALAAAESASKKLVLLGSGEMDGEMQKRLGLCRTGEITENRSAYLQVEPSNGLEPLEGRGWILLDGSFARYTGWPGTLPRVERAWFGPPERCFGHRLTEDRGLLRSPGGHALLPWDLGGLYHRLGYSEYREMLGLVLSEVSPETLQIGGNLPPQVEAFWDRSGDGFLLQLLNLTGHHGVTVEEPVSLSGLWAELPGRLEVDRVLTGGVFTAEAGQERTKVSLDRLEEFAAVLLKEI